MEVTLHSQAGSNGKLALSDAIFKTELPKGAVLKNIRVIEGNSRSPISKTLTKAEVRGGGRKPYRQKGTGHARQGSIRNPHYKGGGIAFGPRGEQSYGKKMPLKERRLALFGTLSHLAKENMLHGVAFDEKKTKTKDMIAFAQKLPFERRAVVYVDGSKEKLPALTNIKNVDVKDASRINVKDLTLSDGVFFTKAGLEKFEKSYV